MRGLMQQQPLLVSSLLTFAARHHAGGEVVSNPVALHTPRYRYAYPALEARARRLARVLQRLGVRRRDRVGTLAWNSHRHLELYYAVSGSGAVCHTINPRLFDDQLVYIIGHAEDHLLFADPLWAPLVEHLVPRLTHRPAAVVILAEPAAMPALALPAGTDLLCYETLMAEADEDYAWPALDENDACNLCYTSGTTGEPKGVLYSHRSTVLHALGAALPDTFNLRAVDRILPAAPMFHVNAWGLPYAAPLVGASLVLAGPHLDPPSLTALLAEERVTLALGVPTVWLGLLQHLLQTGARLPYLQRLYIGGSACPELLFRGFAELGVHVDHAWGMTETSSVATANRPKPRTSALAPEAAARHRLKQGRALFGVDLKLVDAGGRELPWDGATQGHLLARGHSVAAGYYRHDHPATDEGWLRTGDVATIDPEGYVLITDRSKDLIKSGGEWISSIELENIAVGHPDLAEAAVIAARHPRWDERPLLLAIPKPGRTPDPAALLAWFEGKVARWWVPDAALLLPELPHTATGKLLKTALREQYGDYYLGPSAPAAGA